MATIVPSGREPAFDSEKRVLRKLQKLDDDWTVFHSTKWQWRRRDRQGDGETDFIVVHPSRGIVVLEAKGGDVDMVDGVHVRRHDDGRTTPITDPFEQAAACARQLRGFLAANMPELDGEPRVGRAVAFPHLEVDRDLGPNAPRVTILDKRDLVRFVERWDAVVEHWAPATRLDVRQMRRLFDLLAPTVTIRRFLDDELDATNDRLHELTEDQFDVLDLMLAHRRALITGGAGTGKTLMAIERTRRLADDAEHVLLVCYNRLLGDQLTAAFHGVDNVTAGSFHGIAMGLAAATDFPIPTVLDDEWWDVTLPALFPDLAAARGLEVEAIVVDEGQDFRPDWWLPLQATMRDPDDGILYVFADELQALWVPDWQPPFGTTVLPVTLRRNVRNTRPIAERVARVFDLDVRTSRVDGVAPRFHVTASPQRTLDAIRSTLAALLADGAAPAQIQVLTASTALRDALRGGDVEGVPLVPYGDDGVAVETVHRFKGLEADVVLLALPQMATEQDRRIAYIGMSRARSVLHVFGPQQVLDELQWSAATADGA